MLSDARRIPCTHQGTAHTTPDEDNPCLICSGDIQSIDGNSFICPFTPSTINLRHTMLREGVNIEHLTDAERLFDKEQKNKIEATNHGTLIYEVK